jgi:hypothetical protein
MAKPVLQARKRTTLQIRKRQYSTSSRHCARSRADQATRQNPDQMFTGNAYCQNELAFLKDAEGDGSAWFFSS